MTIGLRLGFGNFPFTLQASPGKYGILVPPSGLATTGSAGPSFAPNAPSGFTTAFDRQWNPTDPSIPGGVLPPASLSGTDSFHGNWAAGSPSVAPLIATPASLTATVGATITPPPDNNATVMAIKYTSGFTAGAVPFTINYVGTGFPATKLYCSCWIYQPDNFTSNGNNIKWFGFQNTIGNGSGGSANHIAMYSSFGNPSGDARAAGMVTQGGGGTNNYGVQGTNAAGAITALPIPPPQGTGPGWLNSNLDGWHCLEWYLQTESSPGVTSDGIFRAWFDGTLINYWNNIKFNGSVAADGGAFNEFLFQPYYGGGGGAAPANEYLVVGRMLVTYHA